MRYAVVTLWLLSGMALADEAADKKLLKELEGTYVPTAMTRAGEAAPAALLKAVTITVKGDTFTVHVKSESKEGKDDTKNATMVVDASAKPMTIDLTPKEGDNANKPLLGIISIEKDTVKLCWSDNALRTVRPTSFESTKANGCLLIEMKKSK